MHQNLGSEGWRSDMPSTTDWTARSSFLCMCAHASKPWLRRLAFRHAFNHRLDRTVKLFMHVCTCIKNLAPKAGVPTCLQPQTGPHGQAFYACVHMHQKLGSEGWRSDMPSTTDWTARSSFLCM